MKYNKFMTLSVTGRMIEVQNSLIKLGYNKVQVTGKRDKPTVKAIMSIQEELGLTKNGCIDEQVFNYLNI